MEQNFGEYGLRVLWHLLQVEQCIPGSMGPHRTLVNDMQSIRHHSVQVMTSAGVHLNVLSGSVNLSPVERPAGSCSLRQPRKRSLRSGAARRPRRQPFSTADSGLPARGAGGPSAPRTAPGPRRWRGWSLRSPPWLAGIAPRPVPWRVGLCAACTSALLFLRHQPSSRFQHAQK
ncbi:uncharacterized protein ACIBXB_002143 [Morphnus guianensis]